MSEPSDYLKDKLADHVAGTTAFTMPTQVHLALYTTPTAGDGSGTEATGGGYARQAVDFDAASGGLALSNATVTFTNLNADTYTHWAFHDAVSAGNMLVHGELSAPRTLAGGTDLPFAPGDIELEIL